MESTQTYLDTIVNYDLFLDDPRVATKQLVDTICNKIYNENNLAFGS